MRILIGTLRFSARGPNNVIDVTSLIQSFPIGRSFLYTISLISPAAHYNALHEQGTAGADSSSLREILI